jgi:putrescine transport system ATP-binding protein
MSDPSSKRGFAPWRDASTPSLLRIEGLRKRFGGSVAIDDLSLDIYEGEFFALLGPSGCGKTTLLRLIAGFERPDAGRVLLDGVDLADVPPHRRPVNMMFQNYALFPHLNVEANVAFGLKQDGLPRQEIDRRVGEMLAMVKLEGFGRRGPQELSGAQRQRVALARALVKRPRVLLLDEPLAALDIKLRDETRFELMELQRRLKLTFIIVTHDQSDAMIVADRIGVLDRGWLKQVATPADIYERPNSRWVADFVGDINLFEGVVSADGMSVEGTPAGTLRAPAKIDAAPGAPAWLAVRPQMLRLAHEAPQGDNSIAGIVADISYLGDLTIYKIRLAGGAIVKAAVANTGRADAPTVTWDDQVTLSFAPDAAVVLIR